MILLFLVVETLAPSWKQGKIKEKIDQWPKTYNNIISGTICSYFFSLLSVEFSALHVGLIIKMLESNSLNYNIDSVWNQT